MAVGLLERKVEEKSEETVKEKYSLPVENAEAAHNAKIRANYARLINPESTINDFKAVEHVSVNEEAPVVQPVRESKPYLVENARADAAIFRADSAINRKAIAEAAVDAEDEENEDLRPTQTTIQYKTTAKKAEEESRISNTAAKSRFSLSKKEKIALVAAACIIVALFVLIIVNSAIISGLNSDLSNLQSSLNTVKKAYDVVNGDVEDYINNLPEIIEEFAKNNGLIKG